MFGIQFNKNLSRERWEELHDLELDAWGFPISIINALLRSGCRTMGDVIDMTETELRECIKTIRSTNPEVMHKRKFEQVMEILHRENIVLLTDEEKQVVLESLTEEQKLREEVRLLRKENMELEMMGNCKSDVDDIQIQKRKFAYEIQKEEEFMENGLSVHIDVPIQDIYAKSDTLFEALKSREKVFSCLVCKGKEVLFAIDFFEEYPAETLSYRIPTLKISIKDWRYFEVEDILHGWIESRMQSDKKYKYVYDPEMSKKSVIRRVKRIPLQERLDLLLIRQY